MAALFLTLLLAAQTPAADLNEALWDAARAGDTARIAALLDKGVDVNAKTRYSATALFFAADKGHLDAVKLLVARGADPNAQDTFYRSRPIDMAAANGHAAVAAFLLEKGSKGGASVLMAGVRSNNPALVKAALTASDLERRGLWMAYTIAEREKRMEIAALVKAAFDARPPSAAPPEYKLDPGIAQRYVGAYRNESTGLTVVIRIQDGQLLAQAGGQPPIALRATGESTFTVAEFDGFSAAFTGRGGMVEGMTIQEPTGTTSFVRILDSPSPGASPSASPSTPASTPGASPAPTATAAPKVPNTTAPRTAPRNWPAFRGEAAAGNGDGQGAPVEWNISSGKGIRWKTPLPGIANSSPIVWGGRVIVTTAVSKGGDSTFRTGLYGDVKPVDDLSEHEFKVYCIDKKTGKILWERTAHSGPPKAKRHTKGSQASSTPVTDGARVVASFGTIGLLVAYDMTGKELWRADLGILDSGWFFDPTYQWGHSSSPIIYKDLVILQADIQKQSYIAAWDLKTGRQRWKTMREGEVSTWGTPAIVRAATGHDELVTNGTRIRAYDPSTGTLLWTLGPNSEVTVATPVAGHGLVYVTAGYPPVRPIYAIRPGATGDISLPQGQDSSEAIAWSNTREGTYIPTPILYGEYLYTCGNNGVVTAYDAKTGQRAFRGRIGEGGAFSASPVAADGKLYFASEEGEIHVVTAGPGLVPTAKNEMKEVIIATPAISDGLIVVRTMGHVYGIGH